MKFLRFFKFLTLVMVVVVATWPHLLVPYSPPVASKPAISLGEAPVSHSAQVVLQPQSMVAKVPVAPPRLAKATPSPSAHAAENPSAVVLNPSSLPYHFLPDDPKADAAARESINELALQSQRGMSPIKGVHIDDTGMTLDQPVAVYNLSYDKLIQTMDVASAATLIGMRYVVRDVTGAATAITATVFSTSGGASAGIGFFGPELALALSDLASQPGVAQGNYEARVLIDDSGARNFIWLKANDGSPDMFFEQRSWWIGTKRLYVGQQEFIDTYLAKIAELQAKEAQVR
jgi:hypothetical protein